MSAGADFNPTTRTVPELVWTMTESRVYHLTRDCPALNRRDRYYAPSLVPYIVATGPTPYKGQRRLCSLCEKAAP